MYALCVLTVILLGVSSVLTDNEVCLVGDFNFQLQQIIQRVTMTSEEIAKTSSIMDGVQKIVQTRWKDARVSLFGSVFLGLATKTSDVDCIVRTPNGNDFTIEDIAKLFEQHPTVYSQLSVSQIGQDTVLTMYHIPTQKSVDVIVYRPTAGIELGNILNYYLNLNKKYKMLGIFLKFLFKFYNIIESNKNLAKFGNYGLLTLIIFYLQQNNLVPSGFELQKHLKSDESHLINDWEVSFNNISYRSTNKENFYDLLGGFFKYYNEFDFQHYIVSPYVGRPIDKPSFMDVDRVPEEYALYKKYLRNHSIRPLVLDSEWCIQDIFEHDFNIVQWVGPKEVERFKSVVKFAAKMYNEVPSDRFLGAILSQNQLVNMATENTYCVNITKFLSN